MHLRKSNLLHQSYSPWAALDLAMPRARGRLPSASATAAGRAGGTGSRSPPPAGARCFRARSRAIPAAPGPSGRPRHHATTPALPLPSAPERSRVAGGPGHRPGPARSGPAGARAMAVHRRSAPEMFFCVWLFWGGLLFERGDVYYIPGISPDSQGPSFTSA